MSTRQRYDQFMGQFARRHQMHELHRWRQKCQQPLEFQRENKNPLLPLEKRGPTKYKDVPARKHRNLSLENPSASQQEKSHNSRVSFPEIVARGTRARKHGHRANLNHPLVDSGSGSSKLSSVDTGVGNSSLQVTNACALNSKLPPIDSPVDKTGGIGLYTDRKCHPQYGNVIPPTRAEPDSFASPEWPEISDVEYLLLYGDDLEVSSPHGSYALLAKIDKIDSLLSARSKFTPKRSTDYRYNKHVVTENQFANGIFDEVVFDSRAAHLVRKEREISPSVYRPRYITCERNFEQERKYRFHILKLTRKFNDSKRKNLLDSEEESPDKWNGEDRRNELDTPVKKQKYNYNLKKRQERTNSKYKCKNDASSWCKNTFLDTKKLPCSPKRANFTTGIVESPDSLIPPVTPGASEMEEIDLDDSKSNHTCNKTLCYTIIMPRCTLDQSVHTDNSRDEPGTERHNLMKISQEVQTDRSVLRDAADRRLDSNKRKKNAEDLKYHGKEHFRTDEGREMANSDRKDHPPSLSGRVGHTFPGPQGDFTGPGNLPLADDTVAKPAVKCERWLAKQCPF